MITIYPAIQARRTWHVVSLRGLCVAALVIASVLGCAVVSVDLSSGYNATHNLSRALDAAALAGMRAALLGQSGGAVLAATEDALASAGGPAAPSTSVYYYTATGGETAFPLREVAGSLPANTVRIEVRGKTTPDPFMGRLLHQPAVPVIARSASCAGAPTTGGVTLCTMR